MFDNVYKENLYKSKINPSNYLDTLIESLTYIVSLDLLNTTIDYLLDDRDLIAIDKFLLICINNINTNIRFEPTFIKSNYQDILKIPISYNIFVKFNQIIELIGKQIKIKSESFYNYVLYKKYSDNHILDKTFDPKDMSTIDFNIYKELLEFIYEYNSSDYEFVCHAKKFNICINEKSINTEDICINTKEDLKEILIRINTNPIDQYYKTLATCDFKNNNDFEECLISFIKSLLTKDIFTLKKVVTIFDNIRPTNKLSFAYFVYLYLTYLKYNNEYVKIRILNIVTLTNFSGIINMIIEFYMNYHPPTSDLDSYFQALNEFMDFNYNEHIHYIYNLLYSKYNIKIDKYHHYIKVNYFLLGKENVDRKDFDMDNLIDYKVIALSLLQGHFDLSKYKLYIRNNITSILNVLRHEYINKNCNVCIFEILKYFACNLEIKVSSNVWSYFKAIGCFVCEKNCFESIKMNNLESQYETNIDLHDFIKTYSDINIEVDMIKRFVQIYEKDKVFRSAILNMYNTLQIGSTKIIGHILVDKKNDHTTRIVVHNNPTEYFLKTFINDLKSSNFELYSEAMDVLYYNEPSSKVVKHVTIDNLYSTKNYKQFLQLLNDFLIFKLTEQKVESTYTVPQIFKYTELFSTKILEFTIVNMIPLIDKTLISELFEQVSNDKINHKILKYIVDVNFVCRLSLNTDLLIDTCKIIDDCYYIIYLLEYKLRQNRDNFTFDLLQDTYYKIKDYDRVYGINLMFIRPSKTNLYYEYKIHKEIESSEYDCLDQFKILVDDLAEWKNITAADSLTVHFLMDCKLTELDLNNLDLITKRRHISNDHRLLYLHEILYEGLKVKILKSKKLDNDNQNTSEIYKQNLELVNSFCKGIQTDLITRYNKDRKYSKSLEAIFEILEQKDWSFFYELGEVYCLMENNFKAKESFKKVLGIFSRDDDIYKKALVKYLELVDSSDLYAKNIGYVKNNSRVWFLYGKLTGNIEFFVNSLLIDGDYKYECIPRIFHILSEMNERRSLTKAFKLVTRLLTESHLKALLLPFFSQIICKINNSLLTNFINNIVISIMSDYKEVYWSALYFIDEIDIDNLDYQNKIYINKIKKMRDVLFNISKAKDIKNLKKEYPDVSVCIDLYMPNKHPVMITDIENEVLIYRSLQAPKRICFLGDDGKKYYYLCKYKDDLRKDSRFTEVCRLINKLFENQNTKLDYFIRTYEVIPCFYNFGLLEYIEDLISLKSIASKFYDNISLVARKYSTKKKIGIKDFSSVVESFKPFMDTFLRNQSNSPYHWYCIRNNYIKTCGVMNIVGWFMGLGDRHTENILLDYNTYDMVHVDLNCIFDKGRSCSIPEMVPFRLTQNIIDGFGALGINGTYMKSCFTTLELLQNNRSIILTNLLSFVYDPLHEWNKKESTGKKIVDTLSNKIEKGDVLSKVEDLMMKLWILII